jgi:hypothetical protein
MLSTRPHARRGAHDGAEQGHRPQGPAEWSRLRRMPRLRGLVVPPPSVRALRPHRLLRLITIPARKSSCGRCGAPNHPKLRARRGLVLGLHVRAVPRRSGPDSASTSPTRPAGARTQRSGAPRLDATAALTRPPPVSTWQTRLATGQPRPQARGRLGCSIASEGARMLRVRNQRDHRGGRLPPVAAAKAGRQKSCP